MKFHLTGTNSVDDYYEHHIHEFSESRLNDLVAQMLRLKPNPTSLLDIGCGVGNTMLSMGQQLGASVIVGVESSKRLADIAAKRTGQPIIVRSVLDENFKSNFDTQFDIVVLSAVLHHLVGRTRRHSSEKMLRAIANAKSLVAPGGLFVIHEPVFRPELSLRILFYVKLVLSALTRGRRLSVGSYWANIGAPRVSFMTPEQLQQLFKDHAYLRMEKTPLTPLARIGGIFARYNASVIVQVPNQPLRVDN